MQKPPPEQAPFFAAIAGATLIALLILYVAGFADLPPGKASSALADARLVHGFPVDQ